MTERHQTSRINVGPLAIGAGAPISVQTMVKTDTRDVAASVAQASRCFKAGADIVRFAVPDATAAAALGKIKVALGPECPIVADIHYDYKLALAAIEAGADGLRLNPGNIGREALVREVAAAANDKGVAIRVGVNAGSLEKTFMERYGGATAEAMVESALNEIGLLEKAGFTRIKVAVKASDPKRTVAAYRLLATKTSYPIHLGLTEAGTMRRGTIHSALAMGILLNEGIGDTIRVSLTADPVEEVKVGIELLRALDLRPPGASVTSCPGCGRTRCDLERTVKNVEDALDALYREHPSIRRPKIAVMGCMVNGPGEARDADIALVGGNKCFALFVGGKQTRRLDEAEAIDGLVEAVADFAQQEDKK